MVLVDIETSNRSIRYCVCFVVV